MTTNPKKQVQDLLEAIETGESAPVSFIDPNKYIQHNLGAKDGLAGFGELMAQLPKGSARVHTVEYACGSSVAGWKSTPARSTRASSASTAVSRVAFHSSSRPST